MEGHKQRGALSQAAAVHGRDPTRARSFRSFAGRALRERLLGPGARAGPQQLPAHTAAEEPYKPA